MLCTSIGGIQWPVAIQVAVSRFTAVDVARRNIASEQARR